ncbi:phage tail sheath subtilisin-like domain-containing protein [Granulicella tundricola]|uniref:phage tail sheath subtilisin-like domain-containing protein n=1 Tax=Granulicella tundricola TaxID=940615 RepID=UPI0001DB789D|nr:phage tail sheath subtilisin-like domain-containing protein [Granulicella tundricola]
MPVTVSYPGVYIEELPSGVHSITGVATSITAFIGSAARGPVNQPITINSYADYDRAFGGLSQSSTMSFAVSDFYANGGSQAVIVRLTHTDAAAATIALGEDTAVTATAGLTGNGNSLVLVAASTGLWANFLTAMVDTTTRRNSDGSVDPSLFNLTLALSDATGNALATEAYLNCSVDPASPRSIVTVLAQNSALAFVQTDNPGQPSGKPLVPNVRPLATYDTTVTPNKPAPKASDKAGKDGSALSVNDFTGSGLAANKQGLYALETVDLFNLLCIPPYLSTGDVDTGLVGSAATYCEGRRAFYLVDPPSGWTNLQNALKDFTDATTDHVGTKSANAAIYFPRINEQNPLLDNQLQTFVPCGALAGIYARTDAQRGVWKAPAGQETVLNGVVQLSVSLTDAENGNSIRWA